MPSDIDAARERHVRVGDDPDPGPAYCNDDGHEWPCDTAQVLAALDRSDAEWDRAAEAVESAAAERLDAARALADELAEALKRVLGRPYPEYDRHLGMMEHADAALAKWEASRA